VRQREEALRHGEGFLDLFLRNPVIDELEKPIPVDARQS
jgi:hypothetical protein